MEVQYRDLIVSSKQSGAQSYFCVDLFLECSNGGFPYQCPLTSRFLKKFFTIKQINAK